MLERMRRLLDPGRRCGGAAPRTLVPLLLLAVLLGVGLHRGAAAVAEAVLDGRAFVGEAREAEAEGNALRFPEDAEAGSISGVVASPDGSPVEGRIAVSFSSRESGTLTTWASTFAAGSHQFRADKVQPGLYDVLAEAPRFAPTAGPRVLVEPRAAVTDLERVLDPGVPGELTVRTPDGDPLAGVTIREARLDGFGLEYVPVAEGDEASDSSGKLRLSHLPPVPMELLLVRDGFQPRRVTLEAGKAASQEVKLRPATPGRGTLTAAATGEPIPGAKIYIVHGFGDGRTDPRRYGSVEVPGDAVTDAAGGFLCPELAGSGEGPCGPRRTASPRPCSRTCGSARATGR